MNRSSVRRSQLPGVIASATLALSAWGGDLDSLLDEYRAQGVQAVDPAARKALWRMEFGGKSCASCHTDSPRNPTNEPELAAIVRPLETRTLLSVIGGSARQRSRASFAEADHADRCEERSIARCGAQGVCHKRPVEQDLPDVDQSA